MDMTLDDASAVVEVQGVALAAKAALTDSMVERLVTTASTGLEVADRLNDPDTAAAVHRLIDGVTALHTSGGLDTMLELVSVIHAARSAATDEMIERVYHMIELLVNNLATREIAELARDTELSLYDAARACDAPDAPTSIWGVLRKLSHPETIKTLNLLLAFGTSLRERTQGFSGWMEPHLTDD